MKTSKITLIIMTFLVLTSCKKGVFCYHQNDDITTETRALDGFTKISMNTQADVYVEQGSAYSVQVETSSNLQDIITTKVKLNTLEIDLKKGKCLKGNPTINVYVTAPTITGLIISGAGNIFGNKPFQTSNLEMIISGSGNIELNSLSVGTLDAKISGAGNIDISGNTIASELDATISGSGSINSFNLQSNKVNATISGAGSCNVHVLQNLDANISGSGSVIYMGTPLVTSNISGSGSVRPY